MLGRGTVGMPDVFKIGETPAAVTVTISPDWLDAAYSLPSGPKVGDVMPLPPLAKTEVAAIMFVCNRHSILGGFCYTVPYQYWVGHGARVASPTTAWSSPTFSNPPCNPQHYISRLESMQVLRPDLVFDFRWVENVLLQALLSILAKK